HHIAVEADAGKAAEDALPIDIAAAGRAAVALREVDVSEMRGAIEDGGREALLLDVHVIGVEMDEEIGLRAPLDERDGLASGIDQMGLVAIAGLEAEAEAEAGGVARDR